MMGLYHIFQIAENSYSSFPGAVFFSENVIVNEIYNFACYRKQNTEKRHKEVSFKETEGDDYSHNTAGAANDIANISADTDRDEDKTDAIKMRSIRFP